VGLPKPTLATVFEVVAEGKVYRVKGRGPPEVDRGATAEVAGAEGVHVHQAARAGVGRIKSCITKDQTPRRDLPGQVPQPRG